MATAIKAQFKNEMATASKEAVIYVQEEEKSQPKRERVWIMDLIQPSGTEWPPAEKNTATHSAKRAFLPFQTFIYNIKI